ncbi:MAG: head morphogenesis protein [Agrobacterium cavarae]
MNFDELLNLYGPRLAAAFQEAINSIKSSIVLARVIERLERGDVSGAVSALQIDGDAFATLELVLAEAYNAGGTNFVRSLPSLVDAEGLKVIWRFGVRNPESERVLRQISSTFVTNITEDQREGLRYALEQGLMRGQNPKQTAYDVAGRVNRITQRREGGLIGLTKPQIEFIYGENGAKVKLRSGNPELMKQYLSLKTRDKRFDRSVMAAIREEKPVPAETVDRIIRRLVDRNLLLRGEVIALEETRTALESSRSEAIRQQIESGKLSQQDVTKRWKHSGSEHPRLAHIAMSGQTVPFDQPFVAPDGTQMMYPHDPDAPASHRLGCKCRQEFDVDYIASGLRRYLARAAS